VTQRTRTELDSDVARLYLQQKTRTEIAELLNLTKGEVREILTGLVARGMPRITRRMTDAQVRAIHAAYLQGASIDRLANAIGFTGSVARRQLHRRKLPLSRPASTCQRTQTNARREQALIAGLLLLTRIDELRERRGLTIDDLAHASGLSMSTLKHMRAHLSDPKLSTILKLCHGLGTSLSELISEPHHPSAPRSSPITGLRRADTHSA
jgi:DNA-binding Xre family transcriptional regulator